MIEKKEDGRVVSFEARKKWSKKITMELSFIFMNGKILYFVKKVNTKEMIDKKISVNTC